jgi:dihydroneopterin aldolase
MTTRAIMPAPGAGTPSDAPAAQDPADRIFLLDHVRPVEIGAYAEEHGVTQRLRFDVTVEVYPPAPGFPDEVGEVINYDTLVAAIDRLAEGPRMTLLETFAERLAAAVLEDPRARRATVRIEKVDRLPGEARLGVEIVRRPETLRIQPGPEPLRAIGPEEH